MSVIVLMFSKYSPACDKIIQMMNPVLDFRRVCIDHDEVRQVILRNRQKYQIEKVPCVLVFYANGGLEKYEGDQAFLWVKTTIEKMRHISDPGLQEGTNPRPTESPQRHMVEIDMEMPPSIAVEPIPALPSKPPEIQTVIKENEPFVDMRRRIDSRPLMPPPVNKDEMDPNQQKQLPTTATVHPSEVDHPMRGIKSDKQENLMSLAQLMQKQRDQDEETMNPNAINKINAL